MTVTEPALRRLTVTTASGEDGFVHLSVSDSGTGISGSKIDKMFEPFFTTKDQGLGLGLSICRLIMTSHGGRLWATNNPDRGATFYFTLPIKSKMESMHGDRSHSVRSR